ncbi:MAG TPA: hypothetical protein VN793_05990 [Acidimicrobiales bacterium]|nr:hypothetical protein [Acidimicrobiales bacterium]
MADGIEEPTPLDLHQAAGLVGAYCAIERRLFELTGSSATGPEMAPDVQVYLDALSAEHAWHAELWADRLPVVSGIDAQALVVIPAPAREVLDEVATGGPVETLAGLFRVVLPRLIVSYAHHQAAASAASEPPTLRALRLILSDEVEALVAGEALVQRLLGTSEAVAAAGRTVIGLETRLAEAGVVPGLVPWPGRRA